jgi:hypothetical protein
VPRSPAALNHPTVDVDVVGDGDADDPSAVRALCPGIVAVAVHDNVDDYMKS